MSNHAKAATKTWSLYTPEQRAIRIAALKKAFQRPATKRNLSLAQKKKWANASIEQRKKWNLTMKRAVNRPEILKKKSIATTRAFQNPEAKKRLLKGLRASLTVERNRKISEAVKKHWQNPEIRRKHLRHGMTCKGGTGRPPVGFAREMMDILSPLGYKRDFCIKNPFCKRTSKGTVVKGQPIVFFIDFALPEKKIAIECDGPRHRAWAQKPIDARRDKILHRLGWKVIRIPHEGRRSK